jgi:hypothetical protein
MATFTQSGTTASACVAKRSSGPARPRYPKQASAGARAPARPFTRKDKRVPPAGRSARAYPERDAGLAGSGPGFRAERGGRRVGPEARPDPEAGPMCEQ